MYYKIWQIWPHKICRQITRHSHSNTYTKSRRIYFQLHYLTFVISSYGLQISLGSPRQPSKQRQTLSTLCLSGRHLFPWIIQATWFYDLILLNLVKWVLSLSEFLFIYFDKDTQKSASLLTYLKKNKGQYKQRTKRHKTTSRKIRVHQWK
jgi:hypothetical protein